MLLLGGSLFLGFILGSLLVSHGSHSLPLLLFLFLPEALLLGSLLVLCLLFLLKFFLTLGSGFLLSGNLGVLRLVLLLLFEPRDIFIELLVLVSDALSFFHFALSFKLGDLLLLLFTLFLGPFLGQVLFVLDSFEVLGDLTVDFRLSLALEIEVRLQVGRLSSDVLCFECCGHL